MATNADVSGVVDLVVTGSAEVSVEELQVIARQLGGPRMVVGYGMSETCGTVALTEGPLAGDPAWMRPLAGTEVWVRRIDVSELSEGSEGSEGVLMVRGHNVSPPMGGVEPSDPDGWFDTGDLGLLDVEGRIAVIGRADERVTVSGFNVHPVAVERVLLAHPAVQAAVVVGVADARKGTRLVALVVPEQDADLEGVAQFAGSRLAPHERPSDYIALTALPTAPTGKVSRRSLGRWLDEGRIPPYGEATKRLLN